VGPGAYFEPTLAGKRYISELAPIDLNTCPNRPLLQDISIKCHITMLQCRIWDRGTGNAGAWEALKWERLTHV
jgi:hypothetical protein